MGEATPLISPRSSTDSDMLLQQRMYSDVKMNEFIDSFKKLKANMKAKIDLIGNIDLTLHILTFKINESAYLFRQQVTAMKAERDALLSSTENRSEISLVLNDLETRLAEVQERAEERNAEFKQQKLYYQEELETNLSKIETDFKLLKDLYETMKSLSNVQVDTPYRPQTKIIVQQYTDTLEEFGNNVINFEEMQEMGWKPYSTERKFQEVFESQGLSLDKAGKILTSQGSCISFDEAEHRGYFNVIKDKVAKLRESLQKIKTIEEEEKMMTDHAPSMTSVTSEPMSSIASSMSSEEIKYLKTTVGKALTLALAEITVKQPKDPIHYLGHYLFKYRYNQELEQIQKDEVEALTRERKHLAEERWHKFIEQEARNAVIDMVLKAEQIALERELKRIEMEQLEMEMEEAENDAMMREQMLLQEEARDKFE